MSGKSEALEAELGRLVATGELLYYGLARELGKLGKAELEKLDEKNLTPASFSRGYDAWYSVALRVVAQVIPDRLADFVAQYKNEKRKEVDFLTYTISDALIGVKTTRGAIVVAEATAALPKFERQLSILKSAEAVFRSSLVDLAEVLQADLFDSEIGAAAELGKRGFLRGGGAVAGVVLEKHLAHVCVSHSLKTAKKHSSIGDLNQLLKDGAVIDTAKWRFIQHLGDLRNLCDHQAAREPTKEDIAELVEGVSKVIKTVN